MISITGTCGVAIDSGTSLIAGPTRFIEIIINMLNVKEDCSNYNELKDFNFLIGS